MERKERTMILVTKRLILRPFEESDAESIYEYAKDERVGPIAGWPVHTSVENSRETIKNVLMVPETYAVCLKEDDRAIGAVGLMLKGNSNLEISDDEGEIGYWLGVPFWGQGIIPEALEELIRHAFVDLKMNKLWCGYFDGNNKSKRCQEKCGFVYHHTNKDITRELMGDVRTEHITLLKKEQWINRTNFIPMALKGDKGGYSIVRLKERKDLKEKAAEWFSTKWSVPISAYLESIEESFSRTVPSWYLCFDEERIIAGMGVIENDFHDRIDLRPNVCAVYTEPEYRGQGIAGRMLEYVAKDMSCHGTDTLYLVTDHIGFYERYGWEFICMVNCDDGELSRMYVHYEK